MRIGIFRTLRGYGGVYYEDMVAGVLSKKHDFKTYSITIDRKYILQMRCIRQLYRLFKIRENRDIWIRTFLFIVFLTLTNLTEGAIGAHIGNVGYFVGSEMLGDGKGNSKFMAFLDKEKCFRGYLTYE